MAEQGIESQSVIEPLPEIRPDSPLADIKKVHKFATERDLGYIGRWPHIPDAKKAELCASAGLTLEQYMWIIRNTKSDKIRNNPKVVKMLWVGAERIRNGDLEDRRRAGYKGGEAKTNKTSLPYLKCNDCNSKDSCEKFATGGRCVFQEQFRSRMRDTRGGGTEGAVAALAELGIDSPKRFAEIIGEDLLIIRNKVMEQDRPYAMMAYFDRAIAFGKFLYGEKQVVIGQIEHNINMPLLDIEKILLEQRKNMEYDPKKEVKMDKIVDADFAVQQPAEVPKDD